MSSLCSPVNSSFQSPSSSEIKKSISDDDFRVSKLQTPNFSDSMEENILYTNEMIANCIDKEELLKICENLKKRHLGQEKKLHKLQIVKQHHSKIMPEDLVLLTEKWITTAQSALVKLYEEFPQPKPNDLLSFINSLQIDPTVIKYDPDNPTFTLAE